MAFLDNDGLSHLVSTIKSKLDSKSDKTHTHNYAGSSSPGGSATSAVKLDTTSAGSGTQPVYFSGGKPVACTSYANATVGSANKLSTSRTIGLSGGATGTATSFDGSANISIPVTNVSPSYIGDGYTTKGFYINTHPENSPTIIPFINNDIAFLLKRGGSAVVKYDNVTQSVDISNVFDGSPSYWGITRGSTNTIVIELTLHKVFTWTNTIYIDNGSNGWRAKNITVEVMNTNYANDTWSTVGSVTSHLYGQYKTTFSYTPTGADSASGGFNKIRLTFSDFSTTMFRIAAIGVINYGSSGLRETFVPKDGGYLYGTLYPYENNTITLGTSSNKWSNVYATTFTGTLSGNASTATTATKLGTSAGSGTQPVYFSDGKPVVTSYSLNKTVPSDAKFTDTTYSTGTANTAGITKLYTGTGTATDGTMTQAAIKSALDSKAASSHGNHVPATETANNAKFLRNDNTWQTVTPANIGAATASHNQASNTINAMTGYSKASAASAITTSDSLNTAIGKIEKALDGKAASSHGNHVPATETANNAKFLRNDNTWQTVTPANIGAAASSHTHNYAGSSSAGGAAKQANTTIGVTTAGTGAAYTATVDGITALTAGVTFTMIPHTVSTTTAPTLNVNGLGAKNIRMRLTTFPQTTTGLRVANFLSANKPVKMLYEGNFWIIDDIIRTDANCLYGVVPIESGGTDADNAADARVNLGIETRSGTTTSGNADYAEVGEWVDGNTNNENRIGYFVAIDENISGTTMVKATSISDVRGVTVESPAFSGNCPSSKFDIVTETVTDSVTGATTTKIVSTTLKKQYDYVAVMGLVSVIDNGTCTINGRCMPADDGTAVPSPNNMGYQVIDRIDSTHVLIAVEPGADMLVRIKEDVTELQNAIDAFVEISQSEIVEMFDDVTLQPF